MMILRNCLAIATLASLVGSPSMAEVKVTTERNGSDKATAAFKFKSVPQPARNDAAARAAFSIVDGRGDANGGEVAVLGDGRVPTEEDGPAENFFFRQGTDGGRLLVDLSQDIAIRQVNTYSWHPNTRGPQVYKLYASDGKAAAFNARPTRGTDPASCGWRVLASVDTRPAEGEPGGQYGVSISDPAGVLGRFRYLLFDVFRTEDKDGFGNTFYSEVDVVAQDGPPLEFVAEAAEGTGSKEIVEAEGGKFQITLDTTQTPDLTEWVRKEIAPMLQEWYPKTIRMLPSEGYEAPARFSVVFSKDMTGVAATSGTRIRCSAAWIRRNLKGEAKGAVFHEMVHVVQQYGRAPRRAGATRAPGWLTEGITDYLRFYQFEPQTRGAEIAARNLSRARYDGSYRITANFLNWVSEKHGRDFVAKLNAAIREGRYSENLWKDLTGATVQDLGQTWKADLEKKVGTPSPGKA